MSNSASILSASRMDCLEPTRMTWLLRSSPIANSPASFEATSLPMALRCPSTSFADVYWSGIVFIARTPSGTSRALMMLAARFKSTALPVSRTPEPVANGTRFTPGVPNLTGSMT